MADTEIRVVADAGKISFNYAEVRAWLQESLAAYSGLVVEETAIASAKADRAKLNNLAKAISTQRIAVKKQYLEPYNEFETEMKELEALVKSASGNIDTQIKGFDNRKKGEKQEQLKAVFAKVCDVEWLRYSHIESTKWLNVSVPFDTAVSEMCARIERIKSDLATIADMHSQFESELQLAYRNSMDLSAVIRKNAELERMEAARKERLQREEAERTAREAAEAARIAHEREVQAAKEVEERQAKAVENAIKPVTESAQDPVQPAVTTIDFRVTATNMQLIALKNFLVENGIKYGRVPKD